MVDQRGVESLESGQGDRPLLRAVGDETVFEEAPSLCIDLRRARMISGRELADVAASLRIRQTYLEALEEGRFDDLPGATYAAGFLRTYSEFLGIDPDEMVERLKRETSTGKDQRDLSFPVPPKEGRYPKPWLILLVLLVAGLAYGGWNVYSTDGKVATKIVSDVSNTLTEAAGLSDDEAVMMGVATEPIVVDKELGRAGATSSGMATMEQKATQAANLSVVPEQPDPADDNVGASRISSVVEVLSASQETTITTVETNEADGSALAEVAEKKVASSNNDPLLASDSLWDSSAPSNISDSAPIAEEATPGGTEKANIIRNANARVADETSYELSTVPSGSAGKPVRESNIYGEENTDFRILIMATADSWVQIQGPDNELLLTRILRAGDVYQVPNRSGLLMVTGNAGALELRVDGDPVGALGPIGVVRRNVLLDPDTLVSNTVTDSEN